MTIVPCIPYPALERHGLISNGDTAALLAADGTIDWLCVPAFDGHIVFGALLDIGSGGLWRVGPKHLQQGDQTYDDDAPTLTTRWTTNAFAAVLIDALLPGPVIVRQFRCERGVVHGCSIFSPAVDFAPAADHPGCAFAVWSSDEGLANGCGDFELRAGDTIWLTCGIGTETVTSATAAATLVDRHVSAWRACLQAIGAAPSLQRSVMVLKSLQYKASGAVVAAPTTSLPERIGGGWNVDYRLSWVRDSSLAVTALIRAGDLQPAERYFRWLTTLGSVHEGPLQTVYAIDGNREPRQHEWPGLQGYRQSKPVRIGNHAYQQRQLDIFGYLADGVLALVEAGGECPPPVWDLLRRCGDFVAANWNQRDRGIWEVPSAEHYTSSRVMCWTALDRIGRLAAHIGQTTNPKWQAAAVQIRDAVLRECWNAERRAFTQAAGSDALDASALLIPLYGFLPPSDDRVRSTIDRIVDELTIDGFVYRFDPLKLQDIQPSALGEFEAAFVPCTLWLATVYRLLGDDAASRSIVERIDEVGGATGLLAEAIDPRTRGFAGNFPLGFSHAERIRTALAPGPATEPVD